VPTNGCLPSGVFFPTCPIVNGPVGMFRVAVPETGLNKQWHL